MAASTSKKKKPLSAKQSFARAQSLRNEALRLETSGSKKLITEANKSLGCSTPKRKTKSKAKKAKATAS